MNHWQAAVPSYPLYAPLTYQDVLLICVMQGDEKLLHYRWNPRRHWIYWEFKTFVSFFEWTFLEMFLIFFIGIYVYKKKKNIILLWHTISKLHGCMETTSFLAETWASTDWMVQFRRALRKKKGREQNLISCKLNPCNKVEF